MFDNVLYYYHTITDAQCQEDCNPCALHDDWLCTAGCLSTAHHHTGSQREKSGTFGILVLVLTFHIHGQNVLHVIFCNALRWFRFVPEKSKTCLKFLISGFLGLEILIWLKNFGSKNIDWQWFYLKSCLILAWQLIESYSLLKTVKRIKMLLRSYHKIYLICMYIMIV